VFVNQDEALNRPLNLPFWEIEGAGVRRYGCLQKEINEVFTPFRVLFVQQCSWRKAQLMFVGALLCRGQRTVSQVLRVIGLEQGQAGNDLFRSPGSRAHFPMMGTFSSSTRSSPDSGFMPQ
jgi:hypothetical protein